MMRELIRGAFSAVEAERTAAARAYAPGELAAGPAAPNVATRANVVAPPAVFKTPVETVPAPPAQAARPAEPTTAPPAPPPPPVVPPAVPVARSRPPQGWGPPVLPRLARDLQASPAPAPPPPATPGKDPAELRLDDLVLSYLADAGTKREG
jgi:hypothetical protein